MAAPDLKDPVAAEAYRTELSGIGTGIRRIGLLLALIGAVLVLLHKRHVIDLPIWVGVIVLGAGVMLMLSGIQARSRYHQLRMMEPPAD